MLCFSKFLFVFTIDAVKLCNFSNQIFFSSLSKAWIKLGTETYARDYDNLIAFVTMNY
ncbi:MAG: hypothetical protein ACI4NE_08100 [Succinivibrio sp.]